MGACDCFGNVSDDCGECNGESYFTDINGGSCTRISNILNSNDCEDIYEGFWSEIENACISIPNFDCFYGDDNYCDCPDVPGGSGYILDECDVCGGDGKKPDSEGTNCCEVELDECGICNGWGKVYECGCDPLPDDYCNCPQSFNEDGTPYWGTVDPVQLDCAGVCGGSSVEDECGVCDDDASNDCEQDCDG